MKDRGLMFIRQSEKIGSGSVGGDKTKKIINEYPYNIFVYKHNLISKERI